MTPQTPSFPSTAQAGGNQGPMAAPLSPGSETRERERVTLLLEINRELLLEVMRLQALQAEHKKEESTPNFAASPTEGAEKEKAEKEKAEKMKTAGVEYVE